MVHSASLVNPNRQKTPQPPHFLAFYLLNKKYPGFAHGNRTGHTPNFSALPAVKTNGQKLKLPKFLRKAENQAAYIFKLPYKFLFAKCPAIKAVHSQQTKTNVMRSELRETLLLFTQIVLRNYDLATMQLAQTRTTPELIRFACGALEHQQRRLSTGRFYTAKNFLEMAGLIFCKKPQAHKKEDGNWQAEATEITFTKRFWALLGIKNSEISKQKEDAKNREYKNITAFAKAQNEVIQRKLKLKNLATERRTRAAQAAENVEQVLPPNPLKAELSEHTEALISKISTKICLSEGMEIGKAVKAELATKTAAQIHSYAVKLGIS